MHADLSHSGLSLPAGLYARLSGNCRQIGRSCRSRIRASHALVSGIVLALTLSSPWALAGAPEGTPDESPLAPLAEFHSEHGALTATLEARDQQISIGRVVIEGSVYNGSYAGPVLRVHPGDWMFLHLVNHTARPTNLHFHGIDTSPLGNSDNMHIVVAPGSSYDYAVLIPRTQPPGLYWYHDHTHGVSRENVMSGLSGALVVEGFAAQFPALRGTTEQLMVLKDYEFEESKDPYVTRVLHKLVQTINGQPFSSLRMSPGETQLWRLVNQSADNYFELSLQGHAFRIIGEDGSASQHETAADRLLIKPASRLEVLVTAGAAGRYALISNGVLTGEGPDKAPFRQVGEVIVSGESRPSIARIGVFPAGVDLAGQAIDASRSVHFSQDSDAEIYRIDGKTFDHQRVDTRVPLGNIEEWTIFNDTDDFHAFHIHQVSFQVTRINDEVQPFNGRVDVVRVPEHGSVTLRMAFTDPVIVGRFMYHCHVLKHEDRGMMANIEVYDPRPPAP